MKRPMMMLSLVVSALVAACGSGGGDHRTDLTGFVTNTIQTQTTDTAEPTQINGTDFKFSEDPQAFDSLFQ